MGCVNAHFIAYTTDLGATAIHGAYALATVGVAGLAGGLGFGLMADKYGRRSLLVLAYVIRGLGYGVLLMATGLPMAILGVVIIGSSWTSVISLTGTVASDTYGLRRLGTIYGHDVHGDAVRRVQRRLARRADLRFDRQLRHRAVDQPRHGPSGGNCHGNAQHRNRQAVVARVFAGGVAFVAGRPARRVKSRKIFPSSRPCRRDLKRTM